MQIIDGALECSSFLLRFLAPCFLLRLLLLHPKLLLKRPRKFSILVLLLLLGPLLLRGLGLALPGIILDVDLLQLDRVGDTAPCQRLLLLGVDDILDHTCNLELTDREQKHFMLAPKPLEKAAGPDRLHHFFLTHLSC